MIKTEFNSDSGILHVKYEGAITIEELAEYIKSTQENKLYPRVLRILSDARAAKMVFNYADLKDFIDNSFKSVINYDRVIDALITNTPKETAITITYKKFSQIPNYNFQVFSTTEAALKWLNSFG